MTDVESLRIGIKFNGASLNARNKFRLSAFKVPIRGEKEQVVMINMEVYLIRKKIVCHSKDREKGRIEGSNNNNV